MKLSAYIAQKHLEGKYNIPSTIINAQKTWDAFKDLDDYDNTNQLWTASIQAATVAINLIYDKISAEFDKEQYAHLNEIVRRLYEYYNKHVDILYKHHPNRPETDEEQEKFKRFFVKKAINTLKDIFKLENRLKRNDNIARSIDKMKTKVYLEKENIYLPPEHPAYKVYVSTGYFEIDNNIYFISDNAIQNGNLNSMQLFHLSLIQFCWMQIDWKKFYNLVSVKITE